MKSLNFVNRCNGGGDKKCRYLTFKVKNHPNLSDFFFIEEYGFRSTFFVLLTFLITFTLFSKMMPNF